MVWYWHNEKHGDQGTRTVSPEVNSHIMSNWLSVRVLLKMGKDKVGLLLHTIYKNELKVDQRSKCKSQGYKILKWKHKCKSLSLI